MTHHHSPHQAPGPQLPTPTSTSVLIPGLPDHISILCLSHVPPSLLSAVCRRWRRLIYSPPFPPFLSLYTLLLPSDHPLSHSSNTFQFSSFDPISRRWSPLPPPPPPATQFLLRHPSFISRNLPIQSISVAGKLIVVAATNNRFSPALSKPLIFDPTVNRWSYGPEFTHPRRWCAIGSAGNLIYAMSGIGAQYSTEIATSVEKLDFQFDCRWKKAASLKDGRFSREAIGAVGWRGKVCVVNVVAKEGMMYDVAGDDWTEMPAGMVEGWRGPAAAMEEEETIYGVEEVKGLLKKYDHVHDTWVEVMESEVLRGAVDVAAARGKVCVVCGGGLRIAVVDVAVAGVWVVEVPEGFRVATVHILPRMNLVN